MKRAALSFLVLLSGCTTMLPVPNTSAADAAKANDAWKRVLAKYVDKDGRVNLEGLKKDPADLNAYVGYVAKVSPESNPDDFSDRGSQLAYYLNSYNALMMYNVIQAEEIPAALDSMPQRAKFFYFRKLTVGGKPMSLQAYENDVIRKVGEEKVHFALNCLTLSCPRLPNYPFKAAEIDDELEKQAMNFFGDPRNLKIDDYEKIVYLSEILKFYEDDFLAKQPTLIAYINRYRQDVIPGHYKVKYLPFDWKLNVSTKP